MGHHPQRTHATEAGLHRAAVAGQEARPRRDGSQSPESAAARPAPGSGGEEEEEEEEEARLRRRRRYSFSMGAYRRTRCLTP